MQATVRPQGLAELIAPISVERFLGEYWDKQPLVVHREDPHNYASLLTLADIDSIIANSGFDESDLRIVKDGQETKLGKLVEGTVEGKTNRLEALYAQYRAGATINLVFLHEQWPPLAALCRTLATELSASLHGNVYLTPAGAQALTPHHDPHDVFVLQLYGTKNWTLHPTQTELPLHAQGYQLPESGAGEPVMDFVLAPGDLAYLPRGTVHAAKANDQASLHLTIGMTPMVWADVIRKALDEVLAGDVAFRTALPPGFVEQGGPRKLANRTLADLLDGLAGRIDPAAAVEAAADVMSRRRAPALAGHLLDLEGLPALDLDTPLRIRPELRWRFSRDAEELHLDFHNKTIDLPEYVDEEIAFMSKENSFTGADLPGSLDDPGRLVLIRKLLGEGFLTAS
jgi:ribosomal protein L16 Arg81 hydroxylase